MNSQRHRAAASYVARPQWRTPNSGRLTGADSQNAQRNYERYLALAQAQALSGDTVGAETLAVSREP